MRSLLLALLGLLGCSLLLGLLALSRPTVTTAPPGDSASHLRWTAELPPPRPAWPDQPRLPFDTAPRPLLVGDLVVHGCTRTDSVVARSRDTGAEVWRTNTAGPVRLALAAWRDLVFAASDDGHLYALDKGSGAVRWKVRGGPSDRKLLGNERLISAYPVRGGPVVAAEGGDRATVYFAAGIWPFMGVFLHAVDAGTGKLVWTNDGEGAHYMKQPHNADAFAGVAPQGSLIVVGDVLLVPGGRSVPAAFHRHSGELLHYRLAENGKVGGSEVLAASPVYTCGDAVLSVETGQLLTRVGEPSLLTRDRLYAWGRGQLTEYDIDGIVPKRTEVKDPKTGKLSVRLAWQPRQLNAVALKEKPLALARQGDRLYVALADRVVALPLPLPEGDLAPAWQAPVDGTAAALAADGDGLVVATREGSLLCYGLEAESSPRVVPLVVERWTEAEAVAEQAREILAATGQRAGYAVIWGRPELARELVRQSDLRVVLAVADEHAADEQRDEARARGLYGDRLTVLAGAPGTLDLPAYFASLVVLDRDELFDAAEQAGRLGQVFASVRPYDGVLVGPADRRDTLAKLQPGLPVRATRGATLLVRAGAMPGAGNWTHEHADAAGSRLSPDTIVKAPLGLLWFGGPSNDTVLPRHGHGPQPQVIDGRAIVEGMDMLRAIDIYTGRLLWETKLPGVGKLYDNTAHQPGANASGSNFVSLPDGIHVAVGKHCVVLDPETGRVARRFDLPDVPAGATPLWSYLNVAGDYLIGGTQPDNPSANKSKQAAPSASKVLFVLDRRSGKLLWSATAKTDGWRHNAICVGGGKLYAIERPTTTLLWGGKDTGKPKGTPRLVAFDLATGKEIWSSTTDVFGTWLAYSDVHDVLVEAGRQARDSLKDEPPGMRAYQGSSGKVLWHNAKYAGPTMLRGDTILFGANASGKMCSLLTGEPVLRPDPLTGEMVEWTWARHYGCNTPMASENLITFRSGAAGFYDLCEASGTGNLGGFRSGCTNNLVVAGGLLVVPDYTRTCTCSYQNQCSLALVPMPDADLWTFQGGSSTIKGVVRRVGVLLGAPGNRKSESGTLWLEHPSNGSPGPKLDVEVAPKQPTYYRRHPTQVDGEPEWAGASGAVGVERLTLTLGPEGTPERRCTVRLYFTEPEPVEPGTRVFAVSLNGKEVLPALDVRRESGATLKLVVKEFKAVAVADELAVTLTPARGSKPAVLSGVEVVEE